MVDDRLVTMQIWDTAGQVCRFVNHLQVIGKLKSLVDSDVFDQICFFIRNVFSHWALLFIEEPIAAC